MRPLEGIKVVEMSQVISAPSCGKILYEMGAEVIKVETSDRGDGWRYTPAVWNLPIVPEEQPEFESLNSGKKFVKLDMRDERDLSRMKQLICKCDVFLTNFRVKALRGMGLDYESLKEMKPDLIYALVTGYGLKGPRKDDPGFDNTTYWGETGFQTDMIIADPDDGAKNLPTYGPVGGGDTAVGATLAAGICAGLFKRATTGEGTFTTCPLFGAGIWAFSQLSIGTQYGYEWPRNYYQMSPTNNPYRTADGDWVTTSMEKYDQQWPRFCKAFEMEEYADHPQFSKRSETTKLDVREACIRVIAEHAAKIPTERLLKNLKEQDLVHSKLMHFKDEYTNEQAIENGDIVPFTYESGKTVMIPKPPLRFDDCGSRPHTLCPPVGGDTDAVLKEFGIE